MSIEFGAIHNLVRTYHRLLHAPAERPARAAGPEGRQGDRVSISVEAREQAGSGPAPEAAGGPAAASDPVRPAPVQEEPR